MVLQNENIGKCLTCSNNIILDEQTMVGELIECNACGQCHEVVKNDEKLTLAFAPEIEEDWGE